MKAHAIDQLPVVDEIDGVVGVVTLGHLMSKIVSAHAKPSDPVRTVMFTTFTQVTFSPRRTSAMAQRPPTRELPSEAPVDDQEAFASSVEDNDEELDQGQRALVG